MTVLRCCRVMMNKTILAAAFLCAVSLAGCTALSPTPLVPSNASALQSTVSGAPLTDVQRGIWLLDKVKRLADSGKLMDPETVGQILGAPLKGTTYQIEPDPPAPACSDGHIFRSSFYTEYGPRQYSWFVPHFFRRRLLDQKDQLSISYNTSHGIYCDGMPWTWKSDFRAQIDINNIVKFTCIPRDVVEHIFPHAPEGRYVDDILLTTPGSDWRRYYLSYNGYKDASSKTGVQLEFDPDTGMCLSWVDLRMAPNR